MKYIYERKINYYETDRMGVVHHSNYIRYMEEARCDWLEYLNVPFESWEEHNITIPVLAVNCNYKYHVTYGDTITISLWTKEYTGVKMIVEYEIKDKNTGKTVLTGETKHCFTDKNLKPINLKKVAPEFSKKFEEMM